MLTAVINPALCIGCTKCLAVCPSGAIGGARRHIHTIAPSLCHACGDCLPVCPTHCISMGAPSQLPATPQPSSPPASLPPLLPTSLPAHLQAATAAARQRSNKKYNKINIPTPKALRPKTKPATPKT